MPVSALIDTKAFLARVSSDRALAREVIDLFLSEAPELLAQIQSAITGGDCPRLANAAHALKGSVANFSAEHAYALAYELEKIGRTGDLSPAVEILSALRREILLVTSSLKELSEQLRVGKRDGIIRTPKENRQ